jgi:Ca2+-binding EF-hand superfamily protein
MLRIIALVLMLPSTASADVAAFHASDADGSGALDFGEFTTFVAHMAASGRRSARFVQAAGLHGTAFARVDLDDDGLVTPEELLAAQAWLERRRATHGAENRGN